MTSVPPSASEITGIRRNYLRWSIPSLVLAMIAASFTIASYFAQQHIKSRYEQIVNDYLGSIKDTDAVWSLDEMRRAELAAKRLLIEEPASPHRMLQSARVGLASYDEIHRMVATQDEDDQESVSNRNELAIQAKARAVQSMQRASKLEGDDALQARLWIHDWRFRSMRDRSMESEIGIQTAIEECEDLVGKGAPANLLLSDMLIHRALRFPTIKEWSETEATLQRASSILATDLHPSLEKNASRMEIQSVLEYEHAKAEAVKLVSESIRESKRTSISWQDREAIFRLRLNLGNPAEAFDFAWTTLNELPSAEQEIFRWNVAASALRAMVVQLHQAEPQATRNAALLFGFAVRFAPDSPQLIHIIGLLLENNPIAPNESWLGFVEAGHDHQISDWIAWIRGWITKESDAAVAASQPAPEESSLVPGSIIAIRLIRQRKLLDHDRQLQMLDSLLASHADNEDLRRIRDELAAHAQPDTQGVKHPENRGAGNLLEKASP